MSDSTRVTLQIKNARISFPAIHETSKVDENVYGGKLGLYFDDPKGGSHKDAAKQIADAIKKVEEDYSGDIKKKDLPYRKPINADEERAGFDRVVVCKDTRPPVEFDIHKGSDGKLGVIKEIQNSKIYSGCRVNAKIEIYAFHTSNPKNPGNFIRVNLLAIQFAGHDTAFGRGEVDPDDVREDFDEVESGDMDDDMDDDMETSTVEEDDDDLDF